MKQGEGIGGDGEGGHVDEGSSDGDGKEPEKVKEYGVVMEQVEGIKKVGCTCDLVDKY